MYNDWLSEKLTDGKENIKFKTFTSKKEIALAHQRAQSKNIPDLYKLNPLVTNQIRVNKNNNLFPDLLNILKQSEFQPTTYLSGKGLVCHCTSYMRIKDTLSCLD